MEFKTECDKLEVLKETISKSNLFKDAKDEDEISIEIDEENKHINFTIDDILEPLINMDMVPPPDLKAKYFQSIIEDEVKKIKLQAMDFLKKTENQKQINFFVSKNILILKELAKEAHSLSREINQRDVLDNIADNSDLNIIYTLKIYLIGIILFFQKFLNLLYNLI